MDENTFIVLQARSPHNERKTVLVAEDAYEGEPADYFRPSFKEAKVIGKVVIVDNDEVIIDDVFESQ